MAKRSTDPLLEARFPMGGGPFLFRGGFCQAEKDLKLHIFQPIQLLTGSAPAQRGFRRSKVGLVEAEGELPKRLLFFSGGTPPPSTPTTYRTNRRISSSTGSLRGAAMANAATVSRCPRPVR